MTKPVIVYEGGVFWLITRNGTKLEVAIENLMGSYRVVLKNSGPEEEDGPWAEGYAERKGE